MQRALDYAHAHGVTLVSAAGNGATDYTKAIADASQPRLRQRARRGAVRAHDPAGCVHLHAERGQPRDLGQRTGICMRKAYYSDYGNGYVDVAAPGGDVYDTPDNTRDVTKAILAAYPKSLARRTRQLDPDGTPNDARRWCATATRRRPARYYQYLQGTSMASPHAAGVAALIVSRYGLRDRASRRQDAVPGRRGGGAEGARPPRRRAPHRRVHLHPASCRRYATVTATHTCEGGRARNGFYGYGIVDALNAAR